MDPIVWLPSVVLGLVMVGVYVFGSLRGWYRFDVGVMVNVMLWASGVVGGVVLVASIFLPSLKSSLASLWLYIVVGGLAVIAVSVRGLYRDVFVRERRDPPQR